MEILSGVGERLELALRGPRVLLRRIERAHEPEKIADSLEGKKIVAAAEHAPSIMEDTAPCARRSINAGAVGNLAGRRSSNSLLNRMLAWWF